MSTVLEIKEAIDKLSPPERAQLDAMLWPDDETPPQVHEKLQQAMKGKFIPGDRGNIDKILSTLK